MIKLHILIIFPRPFLCVSQGLKSIGNAGTPFPGRKPFLQEERGISHEEPGRLGFELQKQKNQQIDQLGFYFK